MRKKVNTMQYDDGGETLKSVKSIFPKARDIQMEYHSLDEEERQWITKWVMNLNKILMYVLTGFILVSDLIIFVLWLRDIGNIDIPLLIYFFICTAFMLVANWFLTIRNKRILKRIDFDNVQECVVHNVIHGGAGQFRYKYYLLWQWDKEKQKFYEVKYRYDLPKCFRGDIVYHPYGMKFYIPGLKK